MTEDQSRLIAIVAPILVVLVIGAYKAAMIRAQVRSDWGQRRRVNEAILRDSAFELLYEIHGYVHRHLDSQGNLDPNVPPLDPFEMTSRHEECVRIHRLAKSINRNYALLIRLGPLLLATIVLGFVALVMYTVQGADIWVSGFLQWATWIVGIFASVGLIGGLLLNAVLRHRLTSAELYCDELQERGET